jgi:hypothetical protein
MAQIGVDCEIIIDGNGFFVKPGSYQMHQPRVRKATIRADNGESYVDLGPGKRMWKMVILCRNDLVKYDGTSTGLTGEQYRDALVTSYARIAQTIVYQDPLNTSINVHFDEYVEAVLDLRTQIVALSTGGSLAAAYEVAVTLVEA